MPDRVCGLCGTAVRPPYRAPAPELAPDLDLRPGEPTRATLLDWVARCPGCGACAPDLAALTPAAGAARDWPAYAASGGPAEAVPFLRWALLCEAAGDAASQAEALLQAAWAADDVAAPEAETLRLRVAKLWDGTRDPETALRRVDVLRRAGDFAGAAEAADAAGTLAGETGTDETGTAILAFQRARIAARDAGRHLMSSALRPPARTPHVAHGKKRKGWFK